MDQKSFEEIMSQIAAGLTGNPQHDAAYLMEQAAIYKDHPLAKEIVRECGRLTWEIMPDSEREQMMGAFAEDRGNPQAVIQEATSLMQAGDAAKAAQTIEPLVKKYDKLCESGWNQDDSQSVYFDFRSIIEALLWRTHNSDDERTVRNATEPFCMTYLVYGSALFEMQRYEEAIVALQKAIRWNPCFVSLRFELGENYKMLGDMESYDRVLKEAHPYIATGSDMARFHRSRGFMFIELGKYEVATAHLLISLAYEESQMALSELAYMREEFGQDHTGMTPAVANRILSKAGELAFPNEETLGTLFSVIQLASEHEDFETAIEAAVNLYNLTGDEEIGELAKAMIAEYEKGAGE